VNFDERPVHRRPDADAVDGQQSFQTARQGDDALSGTARRPRRRGGGRRRRGDGDEAARGEDVADGVKTRTARGGGDGRRRPGRRTCPTGHGTLQRLSVNLHPTVDRTVFTAAGIYTGTAVLRTVGAHPPSHLTAVPNVHVAGHRSTVSGPITKLSINP